LEKIAAFAQIMKNSSQSCFFSSFEQQEIRQPDLPTFRDVVRVDPLSMLNFLFTSSIFC